MAKRVKGEGSIFRNEKKNIWVGQYYDGFNENGKSVRKTIYGKTKTEVSKKLNDIMYKKENNLYLEKSNITFFEIIEKNRQEKYEANIIGDGKYARLKSTEKKIKENNIANMPIQDIKSSDIQEFLNSNSNLSESYIRKIYELLNGAFKKTIKKE